MHLHELLANPEQAAAAPVGAAAAAVLLPAHLPISIPGQQQVAEVGARDIKVAQGHIDCKGGLQLFLQGLALSTAVQDL
jgi:hypothetical protein